ncbi:choice-of-anchor B family protein [Neolewinella persica]|uniref:choice-of-anchor B family protein n=1 Tax=Neolewinella persica TaxID=70998 RepID=UPI00037AF9AD|nr:choice-of-anchor B family protein [Neolewinella persica]
MKYLLTIIFALIYLAPLSAQTSQNMVSLGNWHDPTLPFNRIRYNDVWGYAANGREYALIGSREFVHVLDVTDPNNITEIARLNDAPNSSSTWRDIKVYGDYAYCVTDVQANDGLQIIDLSNLPTSAEIIYRSTDEFTKCHNIFIDTTASPVRMYAFGTNAAAANEGYFAYSLADPTSPVLIASVDLTNNGQYMHDAYVVNDTMYGNSEGRGLYVYDVSDVTAPVELGILNNYVESGYNHSCWRSANGKYLAMCDETTNRGVKIVNVEDPMDMEVVSVFRSTLLAPNMASLAHNPFYLGDSLVVLSYYGDGVQVWDVRNPAAPRRLAYYDTTPTGTGYVDGAWGAYPYLPSGNILVSDEITGLYVVRVNDFNSLPVTYLSWEAESDGKNSQLSWSTSEETDNLGWDVEHAVDRGAFAPVGFVEAGEGTYAFTHEVPGEGLHYYRLRQRDHDGTENLSEVKTVIFAGGEDQINVYPNPARAGTDVRLEGMPFETKWCLTNVEGTIVLKGKGQTLGGQSVAAGIYFLETGGKVLGKVVFVE